MEASRPTIFAPPRALRARCLEMFARRTTTLTLSSAAHIYRSFVQDRIQPLSLYLTLIQPALSHTHSLNHPFRALCWTRRPFSPFRNHPTPPRPSPHQPHQPPQGGLTPSISSTSVSSYAPPSGCVDTATAAFAAGFLRGLGMTFATLVSIL